MQSSRCNSPTQLPQSSIIGTTGFLRKRITTFFKARVPCRGRDASKGIIILSIGSSGDTWREMVYSGNLKENFLDQKEKLIYIYHEDSQSVLKNMKHGKLAFAPNIQNAQLKGLIIYWLFQKLILLGNGDFTLNCYLNTPPHEWAL